MPDLADGLSSGRYVLTVTDPQTNRQTSVRFQTGSALTDPEQLEPNIFSLSVNKPTYRPGEAIEITANVSSDGPILIAIADTDIRQWIAGTVKNNTATIKMTADPAWSGKQLYLLRLLLIAQLERMIATLGQRERSALQASRSKEANPRMLSPSGPWATLPSIPYNPILPLVRDLHLGPTRRKMLGQCAGRGLCGCLRR